MGFSVPRTARSERRAHFAPSHEILSKKNSGLRWLQGRASFSTMPAPDSPVPEALPRHRPLCTIASWVVPAIGALVTCIFYQIAVAHRVNGDWLPGLDRLIIGSIITAAITTGVGLAALLRRERNSWLALLPLLTSLGVLLYLVASLIRSQRGA